MTLEINKQISLSTVAESEAFFKKELGKLVDKPSMVESRIEKFEYTSWRDMHAPIYECIAEVAKKDGTCVPERILRILTNQRIRNGPAICIERYKELFRRQIDYFVERHEPVQIIIPSFPFKLPNPLRNNSIHTGIAEIAAITQLAGITDAIREVYTLGAEIVIASDGILYADLFGVGKDLARLYRSELKNIIESLGASIRIVDIVEELVPQLSADWEAGYTDHKSALRSQWDDLRKRQDISALARNSKRNLNLDRLVGEGFVPKHGVSAPHEFDYFFDVAYGENMFNDSRREIIDQSIEDFTVGYIALNYALRELNVLETFFPNSLRGTVHPKDGQFGLHLVNKKTQPVPWAGMGVIKHGGDLKNGFTRVRFWYDIAREPERYVMIKQNGSVLGYQEIDEGEKSGGS